MKVYIAGPLFKDNKREILNKLDRICKELGFDTFLPHRDAGVYKEGNSKPFFIRDRDEINICNAMLAYLDWDSISSGTAWEIGYAYAKGIPIIGVVEDIESFHDFHRLCVMTYNSVELIDINDIKKLKERLLNLKSL